MQFDVLKTRIQGDVIADFDATHAAAHDALVWNGRKPARRAKAIVRVASVADIQETVRFAAAQGMTVSPRGGGHQFTGISTKADVVVDLGRLDGLQINARARTARIEPAVTNARLIETLGAQGLAFPVGHCGSVPISGYLLGGGIGWNSGAWGIACFSVQSVEVVMADGRLLTASATENADVFWAVRGAGPKFFGIVTAYHVRLQVAPKSILTTVRFYPLEMVEDVAVWAEKAMAVAPTNVEFTTKLCSAPPEMPVKGPIVEAIATVFAATEAEAKQTLAQIGRAAPEGMLHILDAVPTPFEELYDLTARSMPKGHRYAVDSVWSEATYPEVLTQLAAAMVEAPSVETEALVMLRSPLAARPGDAAFSRVGRIFGAVYSIWQDPARDAAQIAWLRSTMDTLAPLGLGSYCGEADLDRQAPRLAIHSTAATARLAELSALHDPAGLFGAPSAQVQAA